MIRMTLLRHGKTPGNTLYRYIGTTDESILVEEKELLARTGQELQRPEKLFVSPLCRCRESAELLYPDVPVILVDDLKECDFGDFENKNYKELDGNADYQRWIDSNGMLPFPNGESREGFQARCCRGFISCLESLKAAEITEIAFVVHGGTIMSILDRYALPEKGYYDWHVSNGEGFVLEGDLSAICRGEAKALVVREIHRGQAHE